MLSRGLILVALVAVLALSACGSPPPPTVAPTSAPPAPTAIPPTAVPPTQTAAPTPLPAATATPVATATLPASTLAPTAAPTATPVPPTATAPMPTATVQPTASPTQAKATAAPIGGTQQIDLNALIPQGTGRDLVMENCMSCHSIAPVLVSQKTAGEWEGTKNGHRAALAHLSDADVDKLFAYLAKFFGPDHQIPDLPPELMSGWTNY